MELPESNNASQRYADGAGGHDASSEHIHGSFGDGPGMHNIPDGALLPTEISPDIAGSDTEYTGSQETADVEHALDRVSNLKTVCDAGEREHNLLGMRLSRLQGRMEAERHKIATAEGQISEVLSQTRVALWAGIQSDGNAVANMRLLADAARLSPHEDKAEPNTVREARVDTITEMGDRIRQSTPTVITYTRLEEGVHTVTYCAAKPGHDGFSLRLDRPAGERPRFMVGLDQDTPIPLAEAIQAVDEASAFDIMPIIDVSTPLVIHTGEAASVFLNAECEVLADGARATEPQIRDAYIQRLTDVFAAARAIEAPIVLPNPTRLGNTLTDYIFEHSDAVDGQNLIPAGQALLDLFKGDEGEMVGYIAQASAVRRSEQGRRHMRAPLLVILSQVCTTVDRPTIMRRLLS